MRYVLSQAQISERKKKEKIKRYAKQSRAICRDADQWFNDLMALPMDQRIGKVAAQIAKGYDYSKTMPSGETFTLARDDQGFSVSLIRAEKTAAIYDNAVSEFIDTKTISAERFNSASRASAFFLTLLLQTF
jgi:hypothetical protein